MRKTHLFVMLFSALALQPALAHQTTPADDNKPCGIIAKACSNAGFGHTEKFWMDCMKPLLLGQSVKGVTVDAATVKNCRTDKIAELKKELSEFEAVTTN